MDFQPVEMAQIVLRWMAQECNQGRSPYFSANTVAKAFKITERQARDVFGILHEQGYAEAQVKDGNAEGWPYTWCELTNKGLIAASQPPQRNAPQIAVHITGDHVNVASVFGSAVQTINEAKGEGQVVAEVLAKLLSALETHFADDQDRQREIADQIKFLASQVQVKDPPKGVIASVLRGLREVLGLSADLVGLQPLIYTLMHHFGVTLP